MLEGKSTVRLARHFRRPRTSHRIGSAVAFAFLAGASVDAAAVGAGSCGALQGLAIPNTTITSATYLTSPTGFNYCQVNATVAPEHDVQVRLPDQWQRRYLQNGGGGFDGGVPNAGGATGDGGRDLMAAGYVVTADNGGHRGSLHPGASFANDRSLTLSYATAKIFDTNMVAKALMQSYYGRQAKHRYFAGCSNGGKNASVAAANFADYFDGVIGNDGVWGHASDRVGGSDMAGLTSKWSQSVQVGGLAPAKGANLSVKTVQACDRLDGVVDGIVSNPDACPFRQIAEAQRCTGAEDGTCLTDADVAKVDAHTSDLKLNGRSIGAAWSATANMSNVAGVGLPAGFLAMAFRSSAPIDPLTYDIPKQFSDVAAVLDGVYSMTGSLGGILNYLHRNKKLILFHGWDDTVVPSYVSVNFFNAVQDADGGEGRGKASRNMRLYMAPGVGHCQGGVGADSQDLLHVLTKWVEEKEEPGSSANPVLAWKRGAGAPADISGASFTRPLCPYPEYPHYIGGPKGNIALAANYTCVRGRSHHRRD